MANESYLNQTEVIDRGWTKGMIDKYLLAPDEYKHVGHGRYASLYLLERVQAEEAKPEVAARIEKTLAKRPERSAATKAATAERETSIATEEWEYAKEVEARGVDRPRVSPISRRGCGDLHRDSGAMSAVVDVHKTWNQLP